MRRELRTVLVIFFCLNLLLGSALTVETTGERVEYEDGSYAIVTTIFSEGERSRVADKRIYTYYNPSGIKCFSYTLYATFSYDGVSSSAQTVDYGIDVYRRGWDVVSHDEYTSGDTAYGEAVFSGPNGEERTVELSLTCDADGNVS